MILKSTHPIKKVIWVTAIILLAVITITASAYIFAYCTYGYTVAEDYTAAVNYSFGRTGTYLPPYRRLDSRFQNEISEESYNAETVDDFLSLFEKNKLY